MKGGYSIMPINPRMVGAKPVNTMPITPRQGRVGIMPIDPRLQRPDPPPGHFGRMLDPGTWARVVNAAKQIANNQAVFHGHPYHGPSMQLPPQQHGHLGAGYAAHPAFAGQVNPGGDDPNTFSMGLPQPMGNAPMGGFAGPVNLGGADPNTFTMGLPPGQSVTPIDPVQAEIDRIHNWINTTYGPRPQQQGQAPRGNVRMYQ